MDPTPNVLTRERVREWAITTPSPLSREGQFPPFTGVPLSGTGRPRGNSPVRGVRRSLRRSGPQVTSSTIKPSRDMVFMPNPPVVRPTFALEFHAPEPHANPAVQIAKEVDRTRENVSGEVIRRATHYRLTFLNDPRVQVVSAGASVPRILVLNFSTDLARIVTLQRARWRSPGRRSLRGTSSASFSRDSR